MQTVVTSRRLISLLTALMLGVTSLPTLAADLTLYVQPIASVSETERAFKPLADYLSEKLGTPVTVRTESSFLAYWEHMRRGEDFDLVLDAAHFTDYRVKHYNYQVLVKVPDTVSFSLVTAQDFLVLDALDLIGTPIATAASPSLGGVRMAELFPNPVRQPTLVSVDNFQLALDKLHNGDVRAALVPTPMVRNDSTVNTVLTTKPVPHMALSASPRVDAKTRRVIRQALLEAGKSPEGQKMLQALNYTKFEPANNRMYSGYAKLLAGTWGYEGE
jgi:ABC-type phosphate/phosphonate transport system substrate-binding protein